MAWVTYDPAQDLPLDTGQADVPATYEGDWVNSADACLPGDMRS
jgi:hypothetical protein